MIESKNRNEGRLPFLTLSLVTASLLVFLIPAASDYLIYNREKIATTGEWWRLLTGNLVHFSWEHLFYNAIILLPAGWWLERESAIRFIGLVLATSIISGLYFLFFLQEMNIYAGLSAIVSAIVVNLCLLNIMKNSATRWLWIIILILFAAKIAFELLTQQAFFVSYASTAIRVIPSAHIIGAIMAIVFTIATAKLKPHK